jgi:hypothetical protein
MGRRGEREMSDGRGEDERRRRKPKNGGLQKIGRTFCVIPIDFCQAPAAAVRVWSRVRSLLRALGGSRGVGSGADPAAAEEDPAAWDIGEGRVVLPGSILRRGG